MNIFKTDELIYSLLSTATSVTSLVGDALYPVIADDKTNFPFVIYKRASAVPENTKDGIYASRATEEITVVADKYAKSIEVADAVATALHGASGVYGDSNYRIRLDNVTEGFSEDAFIQVLTFEVIY